MVGVPGRSKACKTCRQRRISCSLERPQCAQCIKSKRICEGYQRQLIIVPSYESVTKVAKPTVSPSQNYKKAQKSNLEKGNIVVPFGEEAAEQALSTTRSPRLNVLPKDILPAPEYKQQLLSIFITSHIPVHMVKANRAARGKIWMLQLPEMPTMTTALETSMLAVCTAKLGQPNRNQVLVRESLKLYTQGLCELQKALWSPNLMYRDETLAACLALTMYEVMECPGKRGGAYVSHTLGAQRLLQSRGPSAHTEGLGHLMFLAFRFHCTIQAIGWHRPSFLLDKAWLENPWKVIPKEPFDQLLDHLLKLPRIFKMVDELAHLQTKALLLALLGVIDDLWQLDADLERWYKDFEARTPGPFYRTRDSTLETPADDAEGGKPFPVAFHFPNLLICHTLLTYWLGQVMVWCALTDAYHSLTFVLDQGTTEKSSCFVKVGWRLQTACTCNDLEQAVCPKHFTTSQLRPLEHQRDWPHSAGRYIFQSVEYCLQDEMLGLGQTTVVAALMFTVFRLWNQPGDWKREIMWADAVMERIHGHGYSLFKYFHQQLP